MKTLMKPKAKAPSSKAPVAPNTEINDQPQSDEEEAYPRPSYHNFDTENGGDKGDYD